jgi:RND family efflux transporter MFP subunit
MTSARIKPLALALTGAAIVAATLFAVASSSRAKAGDKDATPPKPALTVTTERPAPATLPVSLSANGNVAAWQEAVIGSESGGLRLAEVRVNVGDIVKKGQVLAVFASKSVNAEIDQSRAALQEAQANATAAQSDAKRARNLQNSGALSEQEVVRYFTTERTANARVSAAKATLAQQQLRLRYTQVVAPDGGVISARNATVGAVVGVGAELFRMIRQGRLEWRAEVTAAELARVRPGTKALVRAASGSELTGKVRMVAPTIDAQTRTALVYVDLPVALTPNAPFKAGMFAAGRFELGASKAMTVPQQAVAVRDGFSYVFRLNRDGHVTQTKVATGRRIGGRIEINGGLAPDAEVVVSGAGFLNDGDLVRAVPASRVVATR